MLSSKFLPNIYASLDAVKHPKNCDIRLVKNNKTLIDNGRTQGSPVFDIDWRIWIFHAKHRCLISSFVSILLRSDWFNLFMPPMISHCHFTSISLSHLLLLLFPLLIRLVCIISLSFFGIFFEQKIMKRTEHF